MNGVPKRVRQAVVIIHGMGEQRPLEMLNTFIHAAIPGTGTTQPGTDFPVYYSTPDDVSDSYESRRYLASATDKYAQTEFFEYHWAHEMQGNKLGDLWDTFRRILLTPITHVPSGIRILWLVIWALILYTVWFMINSDILSSGLSVEKVITALFGGGLVATVMTWLLTKFLPGKITSSFVDVVRYLDTSPRSYAVRKNIRKGIIEFLQSLHDHNRYQRIIVVAHSLGAYIAYDGIAYLWIKMNQQHCAKQNGNLDPAAVSELEGEAQKLLDPEIAPDKKNPTAYRKAQRKLWKALRKQGCPWLISDFISVGTPMYMADQLLTRNRKDFDDKVRMRHIATNPPQPDLPGPSTDKTLYTYPYKNGSVIYHAAPFAVVRWTNMWFPARLSFFGDWFGGPLRALFGYGIKDIELKGNKPRRLIPALAHTLYFKFHQDESPESVTTKLQEAMELESTNWLQSMLDLQECPETEPLERNIENWIRESFNKTKESQTDTHGT